MRSSILLVGLVLTTSCVNLDDETKIAVPYVTPAGERTVRAAFEIIALTNEQLALTFERMAPNRIHPVMAGVEPRLPGNSLPTSIKAGESKTGFDGPVLGPDGATAWFAQDVTVTHEAATNGGVREIDSTVRIYLRATPSADLSKGWPKTMLTLEVAAHGLTGLYDGYRTSLKLAAESTDVYTGTLEQWFETPNAPVSYAKYFTGSTFKTTYSVVKDDAFEPDWNKAASAGSLRFVKTNENTIAQELYYVDRQPVVESPAEAPPRTNAAIAQWFGHWRRSDTLDQMATISKGAYTLRGPATYGVVAYWGQGASDPLVFDEPAYAEAAAPRGSAFADPATTASTGLHGWFSATVQAGADFTYRKSKTEDDATFDGTCSGGIVYLPHDGSECRLTVAQCEAIPTGKFWAAECE